MHKLRRSALAAAVLAIAVPTAALAEWQGTTWHMSRAEVRRAWSFPLAENPAPNKSHSSPDLVGDYSTQDFEFRARFSFDARDQLIDIELRPKNPALCGRLVDALKGRYGRAAEQHVSSIDTYQWKDESGGNTLTLFVSRTPDLGYQFCAYGISPLASNQGNGL